MGCKQKRGLTLLGQSLQGGSGTLRLLFPCCPGWNGHVLAGPGAAILDLKMEVTYWGWQNTKILYL